jgi:hypothetical protein
MSVLACASRMESAAGTAIPGDRRRLSEGLRRLDRPCPPIPQPRHPRPEAPSHRSRTSSIGFERSCGCATTPSAPRAVSFVQERKNVEGRLPSAGEFAEWRSEQPDEVYGARDLEYSTRDFPREVTAKFGAANALHPRQESVILVV